MASTRVEKVYTNTGNRRTYTVSAWVKRCKLGATQDVISAYRSTDGLQTDVMRFPSDDSFQFYMHSTNSAGNCELKTNRKFRDPNAWYHFVVRVDTTQSTNTDRVRIYVNGVQETSFATANYMNQNGEGVWGIGATHTTHTIGAVGTANYFDGCVTHVHYSDGYSYEPTVFGSTDSITGEWNINTSPSFTLGTNGFTILKDGTTVTDQSSNSNDFSVANGTLTFTHDNPSNLFCTLNPIIGRSTPTYSIGNTKTGSSSDGHYVIGTIGSKAGYYEIKLGQNPNGQQGSGLTMGCFDSNYGTYNLSATNIRSFKTNHAYDAHYSVDDLGGGNSWEGTTTGVSAAAGDIIGVAWKNGKLYVAKNNTYFFSANPSNNTDGSTQVLLNDSNAYQLPISKSNVSGMTNSEWNFGNGYFGTTAITSNSGNGYADANGQGKFQYQPPTGCYALCTKNLNV